MQTFAQIPPLYPKEERGIHVIIETPRGSGSKFAFNKAWGVFEFSRHLRRGMTWPVDFGFIPNTLADDGDALDVALIAEEAMFPGVLVACRVIGAIGLHKNGKENNRLLAVPARSKKAISRFDEIVDLGDLHPRQVKEIESFLSDYNTFEGHTIHLTGWQNAERAFELVRVGIEKAGCQQNHGARKIGDGIEI